VAQPDYSEARTRFQPLPQIIPCDLLRILIQPRLSDGSRWKALHGLTTPARAHLDYVESGFASDHGQRPHCLWLAAASPTRHDDVYPALRKWVLIPMSKWEQYGVALVPLFAILSP
jgi:hypothetical protein